MRKRSKNSTPKARALKLDEEVLDLRIQGYSYPKIAKHLGISVGGAYKSLNRALERLEKEVGETAREIIKQEIARIDEILPNAIERAKEGNDKAVNSVIKLMERRAKYLGLDEPDKLMINGGISVNVVDYGGKKKGK